MKKKTKKSKSKKLTTEEFVAEVVAMIECDTFNIKELLAFSRAINGSLETQTTLLRGFMT